MSGFANKGPQDYPPASVYPSGPALIDMSVIAAGGGHSAVNAIVARAGGGQPLATPLPAGINRIATCATAGDSVMLPVSVGGQIVAVYNAGAAACTVYPAIATSTINGAASASLPNTKSALFCSSATGAWFMVLSA
jgi:hypothetical protein